MKRRRNKDHSWQEASLVSDKPTDTSPLTELARLLKSSFASVGEKTAVAAEDFEVYSPDHEERLLREPWASDGVASCRTRPCVFGRRCVGMHPCIPGHDESGGVVLAESMSPNELERFERSGTLPEIRRPCILCTRANVTDEYTRLRQQRSKAGSQPPPYVINWYCNPVGDGGYDPSACIPFVGDGDAWLGLYGTFVIFEPTKLRLVQDKETRRWRITQSGLRKQSHFESGAACDGPSEVFDDSLRRFLIARPDIHDSPDLVRPWVVGSLEEDAYYRGHRMAQLIAAYGMAAGARMAHSMATAEDTCHEVLRTRDATAVAKSAVTPPWLAIQMLNVASVPCTKARPRRKRTRDDNGEAALACVISRSIVEYASSRSVNEAAAAAAAEAQSLDALASMISRSLMGGYRSCVRRPPVAWRNAIAMLSNERIVEVVLSLPSDTPLVSSAVVEYAANLNDTEAVSLGHLCGGADRWKMRVDRARLVMETIRAAFDASADCTEAALAKALMSMSDAARRAYRRSPMQAAAGRVDAPEWVELEKAVAKAHPTRPDLGLLELMAASDDPLAVALERVTENAAIACMDPSSSCIVSEDEKAFLSRAIRTVHCARRIRTVKLCNVGSDMKRDIVVCMQCFAVKNFINRRDETRAASACGFRNMMPPNRLFNEQKPRCTATPQCSGASLFITSVTAASDMLIADEDAIIVSRCCGLVCSASAVVPCPDGTWKCVACYS